MSKYEAVYFVGDNQAIHRVRIDSSKTRNRGAFSGSLAALLYLCSMLAFSGFLYASIIFITNFWKISENT